MCIWLLIPVSTYDATKTIIGFWLCVVWKLEASILFMLQQFLLHIWYIQHAVTFGFMAILNTLACFYYWSVVSLYETKFVCDSTWQIARCTASIDSSLLVFLFYFYLHKILKCKVAFLSLLPNYSCVLHPNGGIHGSQFGATLFLHFSFCPDSCPTPIKNT